MKHNMYRENLYAISGIQQMFMIVSFMHGISRLRKIIRPGLTEIHIFNEEKIHVK